MKVCAFLTDGFETVEALAVVDILRRADIKTDVISITGDINVKSAQGVIVQADELLDEYVFENVCQFQKERMENKLPMVPILWLQGFTGTS